MSLLSMISPPSMSGVRIRLIEAVEDGLWNLTGMVINPTSGNGLFDEFIRHTMNEESYKCTLGSSEHPSLVTHM